MSGPQPWHFRVVPYDTHKTERALEGDLTRPLAPSADLTSLAVNARRLQPVAFAGWKSESAFRCEFDDDGGLGWAVYTVNEGAEGRLGDLGIGDVAGPKGSESRGSRVATAASVPDVGSLRNKPVSAPAADVPVGFEVRIECSAGIEAPRVEWESEGVLLVALPTHSALATPVSVKVKTEVFELGPSTPTVWLLILVLRQRAWLTRQRKAVEGARNRQEDALRAHQDTEPEASRHRRQRDSLIALEALLDDVGALERGFAGFRANMWCDEVPGRRQATELLRGLHEAMGTSAAVKEASTDLEALSRLTQLQVSTMRTRVQAEEESQRNSALALRERGQRVISALGAVAAVATVVAVVLDPGLVAALVTVGASGVAVPLTFWAWTGKGFLTRLDREQKG